MGRDAGYLLDERGLVFARVPKGLLESGDVFESDDRRQCLKMSAAMLSADEVLEMADVQYVSASRRTEVFGRYCPVVMRRPWEPHGIFLMPYALIHDGEPPAPIDMSGLPGKDALIQGQSIDLVLPLPWRKQQQWTFHMHYEAGSHSIMFHGSGRRNFRRGVIEPPESAADAMYSSAARQMHNGYQLVLPARTAASWLPGDSNQSALGCWFF